MMVDPGTLICIIAVVLLFVAALSVAGSRRP